jgi:hypothetical protein
MKKKLSGQLLEQRWKELAGGQPVTERKDTLSTIVDIREANNGQVFGILKENSKYFIKLKTTVGNIARAEDFDYIGGLQNKMMESFNSINDATRRLNAKIYSINESTDIIPEETEEELLQQLDDKSGDGAEEPAMDTPAEEPAMDTPAEEPAMDTPAEEPAMDTPAMDIPAEEPAEEPAMDTPAMDTPAMDAPAEEPAMDAPAEEPAMDAPAEEPAMDDEAPEGDETPEGGSSEEIQSLLGKLGAVINQEVLSPQETKNILNTIISASKAGIAQLDFSEKEEIAKRIQKDGQKIDEDVVDDNESIANEEGEMVADSDTELYEEVGQGVDFASFCNENGFATNNDDDVVKAIIAYATKHASNDIEADFESLAIEVNPYIFNKIEQVVDEDFLEELKNTLSFEQMNLGGQSSTLNESHLDKVITKLVLAMIDSK